MKKKVVLLASVSVFLSTALSLWVVGLLELQVAYASPYANMDVDTAHNMITSGLYPDLVVLDVRTKIEYDGGHIYSAVWIPHTELDTRIGELAGHENHEIIVYCLSGGRSATASGILDSYNFTKVYNMLGGISAWQVAGYPVWIATVHNVDTTLNYDTIQVAIDAPQTLSGHTILVDAGTYYENVLVNKTVTLIGENKHNTIIDGNFTGTVIKVTANNVSIQGFTIRGSGCACSDYRGVSVENSRNINVTDNVIIENGFGIRILWSYEIIVARNDIVDNFQGINVGSSFGSVFYHNNIVDNYYQAVASGEYTWDDGYPSGGNYWSDYNGTDFNSGSGQNETGSDGIGDGPYEIDSYPPNIDRFPLMGPINFFNACTWNETTHYVHTVSNSTVSDFYFSEDDELISFNVAGQDGTVGFCRICIPKALMNDTYKVFVNGTEVPYALLPCSNCTHSYLYFTYNHPTQEVVIIPESPSFLILPLFMIATLLAVIVYRRKHFM